ncbi:SIMPL domain-containing protein [Bacillus marinisedimentorum]|uniref:SIMPL domain-containing protein n=1 Tax=Bacillus marinisedimentorum TaxID=1821260 RepID=UPI0008725F1F|nr:SIMPL domain-containing protein [Bacillus marinisedimentorum]
MREGQIHNRVDDLETAEYEPDESRGGPWAFPVKSELERGTLKVYGSGSVFVVPDMAVISFGIMTESENVTEAQQANAEKANRLVAALRQMGIAKNDIKTAGYTIVPRYDFVEGKQVFRAYEVRHRFEVQVRDVSMAGRVIDLAAASGANIDYDVEFRLSNEEKYYRKALQRAAIDAGKKAEAVSMSAGLRLIRIPESITELPASRPEPKYVQAFAAQMESATPVEPGRQEIEARVESVYRYC